ncbi:hypothetical protein M378DRAFT_64574 [Amanita muscaria Koide BX008]|uniref:Uncharacterized protein n=1 Tax=Amanita muscaria (strain Koide BX008) TaxID=946122 RepID=A0A0C2XQ26_AMAMK|nr:hypothetical protein M378DRAFT_64574 [Amanita muscaria Koide BX008]
MATHPGSTRSRRSESSNRFQPYTRKPGRSHERGTETEQKATKQAVPVPIQVSSALQLAWAPATRRKYDTSVKEFISFCDKQRVPEEDRSPASEMLLAMYAASLVGQVAGGTISGKLAAVRAWHIQHNQAWQGSTLLQYVLKGAANATPSSSKQKRRPPVTVNMLQELHDNLDLADHLDTAVYAIATVAFYGQLRLGEICTSKDEYTAFNRATSPSKKHLKPPHSEAGSRILRLPWTKVKRAKGEEVAICRQLGDTDPIKALDRHMQINEITTGDTALASYSTLQGKRKLLTVSRFMKRCNEIWIAAGRERHTGHCFRIGGTTHYLLHNVPPDAVKLAGRWSSDAFLRYWRQLDVVTTVHTELLRSGGVRSAAR